MPHVGLSLHRNYVCACIFLSSLPPTHHQHPSIVHHLQPSPISRHQHPHPFYCIYFTLSLFISKIWILFIRFGKEVARSAYQGNRQDRTWKCLISRTIFLKLSSVQSKSVSVWTHFLQKLPTGQVFHWPILYCQSSSNSSVVLGSERDISTFSQITLLMI